MNIEPRELKLQHLLQEGRPTNADVVVIYDGQCIFCNSFIKLMRLRAAAGTVLLLDARTGNVARHVREILGLDLDEGMLVLYGRGAYYGADAMFVLSNLTSSSNTWNTAMATIFGSRQLSRTLYPILKFGRNAALFVLGRPRIGPSSGK